MITDLSSIVVNFQKRRDASFYLCGETFRFLYHLCSRCYTPDTAPLERAWFLLLKFHTGDATFMSEEDFLLRIKLTNKVVNASKARAEGLHFGKKSERAAIPKTAEKAKTDFVSDSLQFFQYLINEVLKQTGLSTDIIKRLAAFDPFIMFKRPMKVALRHFDLLYRTFCLRSWVSKDNESTCPDKQTQLLDHFRIWYGSNCDVTSTSRHLIEFLMGLDFLQDREHLLYLFTLFCLSITSPGPTYPDARLGVFPQRFTRVDSQT